MKKIVLICMIGVVAAGCSKKKADAPTSTGPVITTYAGNGTYGYTGDGGPATAAELKYPIDVTTDNSGNLYVVDNEIFIRKITVDGIISTIAGSTNYTLGISNGDGGPATATNLMPIGLAIDNSGNIYFGDQNYVSVRKINAAGIISTIAGGSGMQGYSGDGGPATAAVLNQPTAVVADNFGNVYLADNGNNTIRKINAAGVISTIAGNGTAGSTGDGGPATAAEISANYLAIDASGNLYFSDGYRSLRKISTSGIITTIIGAGALNTDGSAATASQLQQPTGLTIDNAGNIYVGEKSTSRVREISSAGILSTVAGGGTLGLGDGHAATAAELADPRGVAIDNAGNLYIDDFGHERIRKVAGIH